MPSVPTSMSEQSLGDYLDALASAAPTPGGGAAVALTLAQAIALLAMVVNVSHSASKAAASQGTSTASLVEKLTSLRLQALTLGDDDARAFASVIAAYRLPRADDAERARRQAAVQSALADAASVPMRMLVVAREVLRLAPEVARTGKASVISDAAIAVHLLAAVEVGARVNVAINLKTMTDSDVVAKLKVDLEALVASMASERQRVLDLVGPKIT